MELKLVFTGWGFGFTAGFGAGKLEPDEPEPEVEREHVELASVIGFQRNVEYDMDDYEDEEDD